MKTSTELQEDIFSIINKIRNEFPELMKFIDEMPLTISTTNRPGVKEKELEEYYHSLNVLLADYTSTHTNEEDGNKEQNLYESSPSELDKENFSNELDVPGSELDDQQESVGSEDEENNYYSLGGDNHNDLEEN